MKKIAFVFVVLFACLLITFPAFDISHAEKKIDLYASIDVLNTDRALGIDVVPGTADGRKSAADDPFTIVWISDTQDMAYNKYGDALFTMGKWIVDNKDAMNIKYIVQTGDAVDNGASPRQWENYDELYNQIRGVIPYISVAGNHEVKKNGYLEYSARPDIRSIPSKYSFDHGKAVYTTFEENGVKFLIVGAGYGVEQYAVPWLNMVLKTHADHVAILLFHDYMQNAGRFSINGKSMFEKVVVPNPNVRMVLCGHVCGVSSREDAIDDDHDGIPDRVVHELMYNYQDCKTDCGQLRMMEFDTNERSIRITTYSPVTERYYRDYMFGDRATFEIKNAF